MSGNYEGVPPQESVQENEVDIVNPSDEARFSSFVVQDVLHVKASGVMDLHAAPKLGEAIETQVNAYPGINQVEVDLTEVTFMDSMTLGILLSAHRKVSGPTRLAGQPSQLTVKVGDRHTARIFELTNLDKVLTVEFVEHKDSITES